MVCAETSKRLARSSTITLPKARARLRISDWRWLRPGMVTSHADTRHMVLRFAGQVNGLRRPRVPGAMQRAALREALLRRTGTHATTKLYGPRLCSAPLRKCYAIARRRRA